MKIISPWYEGNKNAIRYYKNKFLELHHKDIDTDVDFNVLHNVMKMMEMEMQRLIKMNEVLTKQLEEKSEKIDE